MYKMPPARLAKLNTSRCSNNLTFPEDKTYQTHNITFRIFNLKRESRDANDKKVPIATIVLPMTQELQVSYNAGYASPDLGGIVAEALKTTENAGASISGMIKKGADLKGVLDAIKKNTGAQDIANAVSGATGAVLNTVVQGGEALGGNVVKAGLNAFGVARNPHKAVLFEGTDFRSHSFNFRLSPITATESDAIRQIIHIFKYHMHPGYAGNGVVGGLTIGTGNHFFETPDFFNIELSHKAYTVSDYRPCVLKGITVNYQPSNYPAYARSDGGAGDPAPMEVVMGLEFQEIEIITKEVIGTPYYGAINPFNYSENYG